MIIGTAGHIDHGKTTLVKALTGVDADRLPEEKARGITLDLGYAYAPAADGGVLGFVDVPGHEKLIHNMLAGATGIDFLLLVVAADDGPMPQTREHLAIADLLGIRRGAVALTKCDAVTPERQAAAADEVRALLAGSAFAAAPIFPVAARDGGGIAALRTHLDAAAQAADRARDDGGRFRLAIDRCFTLAGIGTVVTGTVFSGSVRVGDTLTVSPPGFAARVRSLHAQDRPAERGDAGQRVALNLAGDFSRDAIRRGMWALDPRQHLPLERFAATLRLARDEAQALRHWTPVHVHLGAEDVTGRVALLVGDTLAPGTEALAEVVLDRPLCCVGGDRFVLRDTSATRTLAGGRVLDVFPPTRHKRAPARLAALRTAAAGDLAATLAQQLAANPTGIVLERFAQGWNLTDDAASRLWRTLELVRVDTRDGTLGFAPAAWAALGEKLLAALAAEHERAPDMLGAEHERLRRLTSPTLARAAFDRLVDEALAAGRIAQTSSWLHLPEHRATLSAADGDLWRTLSPLLDAAPFQPPRVRDIAKATNLAEDTVRALMKRVARSGRLYPVALDHYFSDDAVERLADIVAALCAEHGAARAADLRDRIGGGRKVAIHILEFFDRIGYTRRVRDQRGTKDEHVLREAAAPRQWKME
ncbi:selenocysteine-specific translation elongation factor [Azospira restricta]|uniref:Selenocysteine-specific elongation factor n=1 Tax=Azospira restricta TaxID=404405 RepID=A0A974SQK9_9RHOO|nr:selenocysteine-specific translation elongation factor [Azospira restricta]QRJ64677.1 selenocysteine-specific translation elongation factor [Azospira restricta]